MASRVGFPVVVIAVVVVIVDQLTKTWAEGPRLEYPGIHLWGDVRLARTYNEGVAFGLGGGSMPFLLAVVVLVGALLMFRKQFPINRKVTTGMGLVVGGGLGNLGDRLFRDHGGAVVDFIDVGELPLVHYSWPVFNVADSCIVAGAVLLAIFGTAVTSIEEGRGEEQREEQRKDVP